jgi:hypothetical protein
MPCGNGTFTAPANVVTMEALGGGQPSEMIAPLVADGGSYPLGNSSLNNFNAFIIGTGTFDVFLSGITAGTTVTSVTFSFGTGPDHLLTDTTPIIIPEGAPEPGSLALIGLGLAGLAFVRRRQVS